MEIESKYTFKNNQREVVSVLALNLGGEVHLVDSK